MGEDPGTAGAPVAAENKDPEQLREDIEATRQELGDTVEALAYKADVKARVRDKVGATKQSAAQKKDDLMGKAKDASPGGVSSGATQITQKAKENPVPLGVAGAFLGGFLLGRLTKRS